MVKHSILSLVSMVLRRALRNIEHCLSEETWQRSQIYTLSTMQEFVQLYREAVSKVKRQLGADRRQAADNCFPVYFLLKWLQPRNQEMVSWGGCGWNGEVGAYVSWHVCLMGMQIKFCGETICNISGCCAANDFQGQEASSLPGSGQCTQ